MLDIRLPDGTEARLRVFEAAVEAASNALIITDHSGVISWINPAFTRLTGYSADEAVGRTPRLLKSGEHDASFYQNLWGTVLPGRAWHGK